MDPRSFFLRLALGRRLPLTRGELRLAGVAGPVRIARDRFGVPHIDAETEDDAWFALGFCQAQDRAFQLELRLRTVQGRLSELAGPGTLGIDRLSRRIGFFESSQRQLAVLDAEVRGQISAFVRGINAGLRAGFERRPPEFVFLRARPTSWQDADVLGVGKLFSFFLIGNWDVELARLQILREDGPDALRDLDPSYPPGHPLTTPLGEVAGETMDRLEHDLAALLRVTGAGGGSNNWVVAGRRTASGRPILANDPHLEPQLPPHWYLAHLRTPAWQAAGASLVGAPAIAIGHNGFCAWGVTAGLVDTVDLFIEHVGDDGRSVRRGESYEQCEARREVIHVKGGADVIEEVLVTPRGPIVGPALRPDHGALSLRAAWLDARPARGFLRLHTARSLQQFRDELSVWPLLNQNVVYADVEGHIAWQMAGEAPVRRKGWGLLPQPGWDPQAGWLEEPVPFDAMPHAIDPAWGFVATANNQPAMDLEGPYLGADWLDGYRAARIQEALALRHDWDLPATMALQMDEASLTWREVRDVVLAVPADDADTRVALELLRDWDGHLGRDSAAAAVFELFLGELWRRVARARAPRSYEYALGRGFTDLLSVTTFAAGRTSTLLRSLRRQPDGWFRRGWGAEISEALVAAVRQLRSRCGASPETWGWGRLRPLTLEHPLGRISALAPLFNRGPYPFGGDGNTVSQAGPAPLRPLSNPLAVASLRFAVEAGDWDNARFVLPGGQSGNPFSPHYDDQVPLWLSGESITIAWSEQAVRAAEVAVLRLAPLNAPGGP